MRKRDLSIYCIVFIVAYVIGCILPISYITPIIKKNNPEMTSFELISIYVNSILAFFTLLAMLTALFKEDIVKLWRKPNLIINKDSLLKEHLMENSDSSPVYADEYKVVLNIENIGKVDARNIIAQFYSVDFINHQTSNRFNINVIDKNIEIKDGAILSKYSKIELELGSLKKNQDFGESNSKENNNNSFIYKIGNNKIEEDYFNGEIIVTFLISCEGNFVKKNSVSIKWDGKWCDRLTDIDSKHLTVKVLEDGKQ